jgi:hypothetical protein
MFSNGFRALRENDATRPTLPRLVQLRVTMTTEGDEVLGTILP